MKSTYSSWHLLSSHAPQNIETKVSQNEPRHTRSFSACRRAVPEHSDSEGWSCRTAASRLVGEALGDDLAGIVKECVKSTRVDWLRLLQREVQSAGPDAGR